MAVFQFAWIIKSSLFIAHKLSVFCLVQCSDERSLRFFIIIECYTWSQSIKKFSQQRACWTRHLFLLLLPASMESFLLGRNRRRMCLNLILCLNWISCNFHSYKRYRYGNGNRSSMQKVECAEGCGRLGFLGQAMHSWMYHSIFLLKSNEWIECNSVYSVCKSRISFFFCWQLSWYITPLWSHHNIQSLAMDSFTQQAIAT